MTSYQKWLYIMLAEKSLKLINRALKWCIEESVLKAFYTNVI